MSNVSSINDPSSERKRSFSFSDEGPILETLDYAIRISAVHRPFYISICILYSAYADYAAHYVSTVYSVCGCFHIACCLIIDAR